MASSTTQTALSCLTIRNLFLFSIAYVLYKCLSQLIRHRYLSPIRHFPGPFWASITRFWTAYHMLKGDECETELALHKKLGPIIRISPTMLLTSSAAHLPIIYARNVNKSNFYVTGSFGKTELLFNIQDHHTHASYRKVAAGAYAFSKIKRMEGLIDKNISSWVRKLEEKFVGSGEVFDFSPWAIFMAYDVISEVGFGEAIGFVDAGKDIDGLTQGFRDALPAFGLLGRLWPITHALKRTSWGEKLLVAKPEDASGIGQVMRFRDSLLARRRKEMAEGKTGGRMDLLQTFIDACDDESDPMPEDFLKGLMLSVLLAGSDTTATTFQGIVYHILTNPDVYAKLMHEIDSATETGKIGAMPQYSEVLEHCPYYVACVKETMRLSPSTPSIIPRIVVKGGIELDGKFVPEGTEVTANAWLVHRDPAVYGDDAEIWRPERWLEDEEKTKMFNRYNLGFGYGSRTCLGKDIAMMELYKAPLLFLRTFKTKFTDEKNPATWTVTGGVAFWLDMWMTIEKRGA